MFLERVERGDFRRRNDVPLVRAFGEGNYLMYGSVILGIDGTGYVIGIFALVGGLATGFYVGMSPWIRRNVSCVWMGTDGLVGDGGNCVWVWR